MIKIAHTLTNLLKNRKVLGSNQLLSKSDREQKRITNYIQHLAFLVEPSKTASFPEKSFFCSAETSACIHLVKGIIRYDGPTKVLCPTLANGMICSKGTGPAMRGKPYRPKLLMKNHANPNLQLWSCKGCADQFLLRVIV